MGLILNIETATTNCSVSLAKDGELISLKEHNTPDYSHSEKLHVFIQDVVKQASIQLSDLNAIAVSKGPGSYTGLRIGVSAAKGLCFSLDIPLISIPTLESLAHQLKIKQGFIIPVLDARRMEVYSAVFDNRYREIRETKAEIISEDTFQEYAKLGKVHLVGSGAEKCLDVLKDSNFSFHTTAIPSAKEMAALSFKKFNITAFEDVAYFEPYYLKDFISKKSKSS